MNLSEQLIQQIEKDIKKCDKQESVIGSQAIYEELIARYVMVDPNFREGLPSMGKIASIGSEFDYLPEVKAISAKLKMMLLINEQATTKNQNPQILKEGKK